MQEADGAPVAGGQRDQLGVRVPPVSHPDVSPESDGTVRPTGKQGMSVAPRIIDLHISVQPKRLKEKGFRNARGSDKLRVFRFGEGEFIRGVLTMDLELAPTDDKHGVVEPAAPTHIDSYQAALAATRDGWSNAE